MMATLPAPTRVEVAQRVGDLLRDGEHDGGAAIVTLIGEPGIGKTTILADVVQQFGADWQWSVTCLEPESELGLTVLADLFAAVPSDVVASLPPPQRRALDVVLYRAEPGEGGAVTDRLLAVTAASVLRSLLARGSVVLAIDDLQWCDPASLAVLYYLAHHLVDAGLRIIATARSEEGTALPGRTVAVPPLSERETRRLVLSVAPAASGNAIATAVRVSGGNPFFARELAMSVAAGDADRLPDSLRSALGRRLSQLPESVTAALLDVAVRGEPTEDEVALDDLDGAFRSGVLASAGGRVRFTHPLLAWAVMDAATPAEIRSARRRAADATDDPVLAALHRAHTEPPSAALAKEFDDAAAIARRRGNLEGARTLAANALAATPDGARPGARLVELAELSAQTGEIRHALALAGEVLDHRDGVSLPDLIRATIVRAEGIDDHDRVAAMFAALPETPKQDRGDATQLVQHRSIALWKAGRSDEATRLLVGALQKETDGNEAWTQLIGQLALRARFTGEVFDFATVVRAVEAERALNERNSARVPLHSAVSNAAILAYFDDRHDLALRFLEEAEQAASIAGIAPPSYYYRGMLAGRTGDLPRSVALLEPLAIDTVGADRADALCRLALSLVWVDSAATRRTVEEADRLLSPGHHRLRADVRFLDGFDLLLGGRPGEARDPLHRAVEHLEACQQREPSRTPALLAAAEAAAEIGDTAAALDYRDRLAEQSAALDSRWGYAATARVDGLIAAALGRVDVAITDLSRSAQDFAALGVPLAAGRSYLALGIFCRRQGQRRAARGHLDIARGILATAGATRLVATADAELRRLSGRTAATTNDLTDSERQVADLAATGLRNREIAEALHLSVKTVETHLGRVYRKLGITGRVELARRLA
ncbi:MAG TPA: LuxR family transcriptional regulator [Micromonosporaceae bacterium]